MQAKGRPQRAAMLTRYSTQLGLLVSRQRTELALRTARGEAERAAEQARQAMITAETANRAKSQFMSSMSHELRTPLNAIIGFSEIIATKVEAVAKDGKVHEYAGVINESGKHLLSVINDILDISRIEAGSLDLREDWADMRALVEMPAQMCRPRIDENGLTLVLDMPADLPALFCDARLVKQIMINLISNASKFTPKGGKIEVTVRQEPDGSLRMSVADTGIGIAPEHFADALAPFRQVDNELGKQYNGTGLGLPLSKGFAELHGGSLELASKVGEGTTVTIRFPAARLNAPNVHSTGRRPGV